MVFHAVGERLPRELVTNDFRLRPLRTDDVDLDYDAVMENPAQLRLSGGGVWPSDDFSLESNLSDLEVHEREHEDGKAFTYTVMNFDESQCLGCVYINPLDTVSQLTGISEPTPVTIDEQEAIVRFWVRHSRVSDDLDRRLLAALIDWLRDKWQFSKVYVRAHERDERQKDLLSQFGLAKAYALSIPGREGTFFAYGPLEA